MKIPALVLLFALCTVAACDNPPTVTTTGPVTTTSQPRSDALQQKLVESSGAGATDCGRLDIKAAQSQLKSASDCAMQAAHNKHAFYVAYDMPGMAVGVAGNGEGKLFTVQSHGVGPAPALTSGACPSQLRVASSGRVSCFAPGDMTSMGDSHTGGAMPPPGAANPHAAGTANPHTAAPDKPK